VNLNSFRETGEGKEPVKTKGKPNELRGNWERAETKQVK
jgi:hypothetical protein